MGEKVAAFQDVSAGLWDYPEVHDQLWERLRATCEDLATTYDMTLTGQDIQKTIRFMRFMPSGDPENTPLVECDAYADADMIRMRYEDDASLGNPAGNPAHRRSEEHTSE